MSSIYEHGLKESVNFRNNDNITSPNLHSTSFDSNSFGFESFNSSRRYRNIMNIPNLKASISVDSFSSISPTNYRSPRDDKQSVYSSFISQIKQKRLNNNRRENIALLARLELAETKNK